MSKRSTNLDMIQVEVPLPRSASMVSLCVTPRNTCTSSADDDDIRITHVEPSIYGPAQIDLNQHENICSDDIRITHVESAPSGPVPIDLDHHENTHTGAKDSDHIEMEYNIGTKCPYTKRTMVNPVKNKICGHSYEQSAIKHYIRTGRNPRCPISGCKNQMRLQIWDLEDNRELKAFINNVRSKRPISHTKGETVTIKKSILKSKSTFTSFNRRFGQNSNVATNTHNTSNARCHENSVNIYDLSSSHMNSFIEHSRRHIHKVMRVRWENELCRKVMAEEQAYYANVILGSSYPPRVHYNVYSSDEEDDDGNEGEPPSTNEDNEGICDDDEENDSASVDYGSEMEDGESKEHNYFDFNFDGDEGDCDINDTRMSPKITDIQCGCEDCSEYESDEDTDTSNDDSSGNHSFC